MIDNSWMIEYWIEDCMDLFEIKNSDFVVSIKWKNKNHFENFKKLSQDYFKCYKIIFDNVFNHRQFNFKVDMTLLVGIFLNRQAIELALKALICKVFKKDNNLIINTINNYKHNLKDLFFVYWENSTYNILDENEFKWIIKYLDSFVKVDSESDMFRFPFDKKFVENHGEQFVFIESLYNNLYQAYKLIEKCLLENETSNYEFDNSLNTNFFEYCKDGCGNCYLKEDLGFDGYYIKIEGYADAVNVIYNYKELNLKSKVYPLMFLFRNLIELSLKRLLLKCSKRNPNNKQIIKTIKSHNLKKLWTNIEPMIREFEEKYDYETNDIDNVVNLLKQINELDKNGDLFKYPTSKSLEYKFNGKELDFKNVYVCLISLYNFFSSSYEMIDNECINFY